MPHHDSDESFIQNYVRHATPVARLVEDVPPAEDEKPETFLCFGRLRGTRDRACFLRCVPTIGCTRSLSYTHLYRCDYDPDGMLLLHFSADVVRVTGRNLTKILDLIERQRCTYLRAQPESMDSDRQDEAFITDIEIQRPPIE